MSVPGERRAHAHGRSIYSSPIETTDETFETTSGFFRTGRGPRLLPPADDGPPWNREEADARAHDFLAALVGDREIDAHIDDPVEHARHNSLLILFGPEETEAFAALLARMPRERIEAWAELLGGGASSEAFGPLTLLERLDERQVSQALAAGRRQRLVNVGVTLVSTVLVLVGAVVVWNRASGGEQRTVGALRFDEVAVDGADAAVAGGPPVAVAELTTPLDIAIALADGAGSVRERIVDAPFGAFPQPPGALRAGLFAYGDAGQVVIVGPAGWLDQPVCLRATVATSDLRALDTVWYESTPGGCVEPIGRRAPVTCLGSDAVVMALDIPTGSVDLPEGGVGVADAVRIQLVAPGDATFEQLSIRGIVTVAADSDVTIPRFGGSPGDELHFDLGSDRSGSCVILAAS
ncbi:MAG: hypothetical protein ACE5GB_08995 [Acidimicrobiales bacterium]